MCNSVDDENERYARQNASHGHERRSLIRDAHCVAHHALSIDTTDQECEIKFFKLEKRSDQSDADIKYTSLGEKLPHHT